MDDKADAAQDIEKQKELRSSMNPLKSHFGWDIGLPEPFPTLISIALILFMWMIRVIIYSLVGGAVFLLTYILLLGGFCLMTTPTLQCIQSNVTSVITIVPSILVSVLFIGLLAYVDKKVEWRKYF